MSAPGAPEIILLIVLLLAILGIIGGLIAIIVWAVKSGKRSKDILPEARERQAEIERDI